MNVKKFAIALSVLAVFVAGTVVSAGALTPMHISGFKAAYSGGQIKSRLRVWD
jgi:hypothetical protein